MKRFVFSVACLFVVLSFTAMPCFAQDGVWKDDQPIPTVSFFVQTYDMEEDGVSKPGVVIYSPQGADFAAFQSDDISAGVDAMDLGGLGHHLEMTFTDNDNATARLTLAGEPAVDFVLVRFLVSNQGGHLNIQGSDFLPQNNTITYAISKTHLYTGSLSSDTFIAPIHVPHGSKIVKATMKAYDGSVTGYVKVNLDWDEPFGSSMGTACTLTTPTDSAPGNATYESGTLNIAVNNTTTSYYAVLVLYNGGEGYKSWFYQLVIDYE